MVIILSKMLAVLSVKYSYYELIPKKRHFCKISARVAQLQLYAGIGFAAFFCHYGFNLKSS